MAIITGSFKTVADISTTVRALEAAGIPRNAVSVKDEGEGKNLELTVTTDADHEDKALEIVKARGGSVDTGPEFSDWPNDEHPGPAGDENPQRRYVTENRDTSREPDLDRDDVQMVEEGVDRQTAHVYNGPK